MTNLLLFLILVAQVATLFMLSKCPTDLTKEDEAVKRSLEDLSEAKDRIPH